MDGLRGRQFSETRMTRLWSRSKGMPAWGQRPLPLSSRMSHRVVVCVAGRVRSSGRNGRCAAPYDRRRVSWPRTGRDCVEAAGRCSPGGDDWKCAWTCTETGRNLDDERKTMGGNQRRFSRGKTGFGSVELVQHRLLRQRRGVWWASDVDPAVG